MSGIAGGTNALKELQKTLLDSIKPVVALGKLTPREAAIPGRLDRILQALPSGVVLASAVEEVRAKATAVSARLRDERESLFKRSEADYVSQMRASGAHVRETDTGWRIGPLELEVDRPQGRTRLLYNRELLVDWVHLASGVEFEKAVSTATDRLKKAEVPSEILRACLWNAYQDLRKGMHSERVPLKDLYREFRVALVRAQLDGGKPDRKLLYADFPRWVFLYNLDLYRKQISSVPPEIRLVLETGAQIDSAKGLAMVLNGLDAVEHYKTFSYVYAAARHE